MASDPRFAVDFDTPKWFESTWKFLFLDMDTNYDFQVGTGRFLTDNEWNIWLQDRWSKAQPLLEQLNDAATSEAPDTFMPITLSLV